jgi:hypothetical protein
MEDEEGWE